MASEASSSWQRTGKNIPRVRLVCSNGARAAALRVNLLRLSLVRSLTKPLCFGALLLLPIHPLAGLTCCCVLSCAVVLPEAVHSQISADGSRVVGRDGIHSGALPGAGECLMCCLRAIRAVYVHSECTGASDLSFAPPPVTCCRRCCVLSSFPDKCRRATASTALSTEKPCFCRCAAIRLDRQELHPPAAARGTRR